MIKFPSFCKFLNSHRMQSVSLIQGLRTITTAAFPLQFKASLPLCAEPVKRKKRIDPAIIRAKEEKKRKKIEKEIRNLMKSDRRLKPLTELMVPECLLTELELRKRKVPVSEEVSEARRLLFKEWAKAKYNESKADIQLIDRLVQAQTRALNELRQESETLYQAAVQIDASLIPFKYNGPGETPPIKDYPKPDGEYYDISKKWL